MQLARSGNGTPPCHRPITKHAGRGRRQLPSDGNRRAARGGRQERRGGSRVEIVVVQGGAKPAAVHEHSATFSSKDTLPPLPSNRTPLTPPSSPSRYPHANRQIEQVQTRLLKLDRYFYTVEVTDSLKWQSLI